MMLQFDNVVNLIPPLRRGRNFQHFAHTDFQKSSVLSPILNYSGDCPWNITAFLHTVHYIDLAFGPSQHVWNCKHKQLYYRKPNK